MFRGRVRRVHLIGIGGIGMSGIAEVLIDHGFQVSGSDLKENTSTSYLKDKGAIISFGHAAHHIQGADVVVYSSAVQFDNPEIVEAKRNNIPVIARAEMLAELMRLKDGIAIAGSHGKTTTTSLLATVLRDAKLDPTVIIGGRLNAIGSNAASGEGSLLLAEADESDGSFLHLHPAIAVITNIDPEHLDHYADLDEIKDAFVQFANHVPFYGVTVACLDHPNVQDILPRIDKKVVTYGLSTQAEYRAKDPHFEGLQGSFEVVRRGESLGNFTVKMPGIHNVLNALATIAVADELRVPLEEIKKALASFQGVQRRFTVLGEVNGITIVDDYAHHPTEIQATLEAAQRAYGKRLVVAYQPHRYSRTKQLFDELTRAFNRADLLFITDVYAAGEAPIKGVHSEYLVETIRSHGHRDVHWVAKRAHLIEAILERVEPGDIVLTLGAGDITHTSRELFQVLSERDS